MNQVYNKMANQEELRLVHIVHSDELAFNQLYNTYKSTVSRICWKFTQGRDFDDARQQCWLKLFEKFPQFKGNSKLSTWIVRVCINEVLQMLRKKYSYYNLQDKFVDINKIEIPKDEKIEEHLIESDQLFHKRIIVRGVLDNKIGKCPSTVIRLKCTGMTFKETAKYLNISEGTAKSYHHRALKALRREARKYSL